MIVVGCKMNAGKHLLPTFYVVVKFFFFLPGTINHGQTSLLQ